MWILLWQTWELYERRELVGLVDPALNGDFDAEEACKFLKIGLLCTQDAPKLRPSMSTVVKMLTSKVGVDDIKIAKPGLISDFMDLKVRGAQKSKLDMKDKPDMKKKSYTVSSASDNIDSSTMSSGTTTAATLTFTAVYDQSIWTSIWTVLQFKIFRLQSWVLRFAVLCKFYNIVSLLTFSTVTLKFYSF